MRSIFHRIYGILADVAGVALVFLMAVTVFDIVTRHLHVANMRGAIEISTLAVIMIGALALPVSFIQGGHIVIDLATQALPERVKNRFDAFWLVVMGLGLAYFAVKMWGATVASWRAGDYSLDLHLPVVYFWIPASIGLSVAPFAALAAAYHKLKSPPLDADAAEISSEAGAR